MDGLGFEEFEEVPAEVAAEAEQLEEELLADAAWERWQIERETAAAHMWRVHQLGQSLSVDGSPDHTVERTRWKACTACGVPTAHREYTGGTEGVVIVVETCLRCGDTGTRDYAGPAEAEAHEPEFVF